MNRQAEYFENHQYRIPSDPVVQAYVRPKLRIMEAQGCFRGNKTRILDVGSGNGTYSHYFLDYTDHVVAFDYTAQQLRLNPSSRKVIGTAYKLPFRDGEFSVVFEANMLHHLKDPFDVLCQMSRCTSEFLILIEPNRYNPLMFLFALAVSAERGVLTSSRKRWEDALGRLNMYIVSSMTTGMISQENTPAILIPFLKIFDGNIRFGEYVVIIAKKLACEHAERMH